MFIPCERSVSDYLPAIRAATAAKLVREHGFSQVKAASALGVTQAAVSGYLTRKPGERRSRELRETLERLGGDFTRQIVRQEPGAMHLNELCRGCELRGSGMLVCQINQKHL